MTRGRLTALLVALINVLAGIVIEVIIIISLAGEGIKDEDGVERRHTF